MHTKTSISNQISKKKRTPQKTTSKIKLLPSSNTIKSRNKSLTLEWTTKHRSERELLKFQSFNENQETEKDQEAHRDEWWRESYRISVSAKLITDRKRGRRRRRRWVDVGGQWALLSCDAMLGIGHSCFASIHHSRKNPTSFFLQFAP